MRKSEIDLEALFDEIRALPPEWRHRIAETMAGFVEQIPKSAWPSTNRPYDDAGAQIINLNDVRGRGDGEES